MKKIIRVISVAAAGLLLLSGCSGSNSGEDTKQPNTSADISEAQEQTVAPDFEKAEELKSALEKLNVSDKEEVESAMKIFDSLTSAEKAIISYDEYKKLTDAEYSLVNGEKLAELDSHKPEVIAAVAKAYYNRSFAAIHKNGKPYTQYDQYNNRRNFNASPEDATSQKVLYLDCSSFVNSVYYYTFGRNLLEAGKSITTKNINAYMASKTAGEGAELMYYISGDTLSALKSNYTEAQKLFAEIKEKLQPGDLINYYRADSGHIIMYLGDGKIIHSIGSANAKTTNGTTDPKTSLEKYTEDEKNFGTVNITDWDEFFTLSVTPASQNDGRTSTTNRYLFASNVTAVAIFRPLSETDGSMKGLAVTEQAKNRYLYAGLNIEKSASVLTEGTEKDLYYGSSVYPGNEITFTLSLFNTGDTELNSICIEENIPEGFEYVSSDGGSIYFSENGKVCFHLSSLEGGKSAKFCYTLRVKSGQSSGALLEDSCTYVNGIRTNKLIYQYASVSIDSEKLGAAIEAQLGKKSDSSIKAFADVYAALGDGRNYTLLNSFDSPETVIRTYFPESQFRTDIKESTIASRMLYGGTTVGSAEISEANKLLSFDKVNFRVRRVYIKNIEDGDIICTYTKNTGDTYTAYLYYKLGLYGLDADGCFVKFDPEKVSKGTSVQDYFDTLTAYNKYVVLRPKYEQ